jgi:tetratricopeptide (TPR) repeat protein
VADDGPVERFCAGLRRLQQGAGLSPAELGRRLGYGRSQMYEILNGRIGRPPDWDRLVEPLVRACTSGDPERAVADWRRRHHVLVQVYDALRQLPVPARGDQPSAPGRARAPRRLPLDAPGFTGRRAELAELDRLLGSRPARGTEGGPALVALCGIAGVGKTALAVRWARRVTERFPDGQLYVDLRGYDPERALAPADAVAQLLRDLGLTGREIPADFGARVARYRAEVAGRRMLVLIDNAATVDQVRPLLPGTQSCVTLVTSRDPLAGLVARDGARRLRLDLLPLPESVDLLGALLGTRSAADPVATEALATQCARLPLALCIAAEVAVSRAAVPLARLVAELAGQRRRLALLDPAAEVRSAVHAVFSWSYQYLPAGAARAFRRLGLHPGPDVDTYAAAALLGTPLVTAERLLAALARARLLYPVGDPVGGTDRYGMHDLLRGYAADLANPQDTEAERRIALGRLADHYLAAATAAVDALHPADPHRRPRPRPAGPLPPMQSPGTGRAWLDTERVNLLAVAASAIELGRPASTIRLAAVLFRYLDSGGYHDDALTLHDLARLAAQRQGDKAAEAHALNNLGTACWRQGGHRRAEEHYRHALELFQQLDDKYGEARTLGNLATVLWRQGGHRRAEEHYLRALELFRELGDRYGEARTLGNLGTVLWRHGGLRRAEEHYLQALELFRELGDRPGEADALTNLGAIYWRQHRYRHAEEYHQQALRLFRELGDRATEAEALTNLGLVYRRQGRFQQAEEHHQQAVSCYRELGDRAGEADALNGLAEAAQAAGRPALALARHHAALRVATGTGNRYEQARAHVGLGRAHHATGDLDQARVHWQRALALFGELRVPDAEDVRAQLAALDRATTRPLPAPHR